MRPRFRLFASPSGSHFQTVLVTSGFLTRIQNLATLARNEGGADSVDVALISPTDRQLMVLLVWT